MGGERFRAAGDETHLRERLDRAVHESKPGEIEYYERQLAQIALRQRPTIAVDTPELTEQ